MTLTLTVSVSTGDGSTPGGSPSCVSLKVSPETDFASLASLQWVVRLLNRTLLPGKLYTCPFVIS